MSTKSGLKIEIFLNVYDAKHRLVLRQPCNSLIKQFMKMITCHFREADESGAKDTGGTDRTITPFGATLSYNGTYTLRTYGTQAGAGSTTYGIILGTGTTAVTYADYVIETLIAHGTGAGQLSYAAMGKTAISDITGGQHFKVTRIITNSSGGSITVNEIALYMKGRSASEYSSAYYYYCGERTILGTPITIADAESYTFEYDISLTI